MCQENYKTLLQCVNIPRLKWFTKEINQSHSTKRSKNERRQLPVNAVLGPAAQT